MLSTAQLRVLRSLLKRGWPEDLFDYLLTRNDLPPAGWEQLVSAFLVDRRAGRWVLTEEGRREYRRQSHGRFF